MPYSANGDSRLQRKAPFPHDGFGKKSYRVFAVFPKSLIRQTRRLCLQGELQRSPVSFSRLRFPLPDRELASQQPRGTFAIAFQFSVPPLMRGVMDGMHDVQDMISQIAVCPVGAARHEVLAACQPRRDRASSPQTRWRAAFRAIRACHAATDARSPQTHWDRGCFISQQLGNREHLRNLKFVRPRLRPPVNVRDSDNFNIGKPPAIFQIDLADISAAHNSDFGAHEEAPPRVAHSKPRRMISRTSGTSKSFATCPSEQ